jgi:Arc/MetJ family transcription regulator
VKTTIEIPDALFRQAKAAAALRAESLKDFVTAALRAHLETQPAAAPTQHGWRTVFGLARPEEVGEIESFVGEELERIDPDAWR